MLFRSEQAAAKEVTQNIVPVANNLVLNQVGAVYRQNSYDALKELIENFQWACEGKSWVNTSVYSTQTFSLF